MKELPAKGVRGFLLYTPFGRSRYFFRVYGPDGPKTHKDYRLSAEDIEVEIRSDGLSLYEDDAGGVRLDWSSQVLGRPEKQGT